VSLALTPAPEEQGQCAVKSANPPKIRKQSEIDAKEIPGRYLKRRSAVLRLRARALLADVGVLAVLGRAARTGQGEGRGGKLPLDVSSWAPPVTQYSGHPKTIAVPATTTARLTRPSTSNTLNAKRVAVFDNQARSPVMDA
jgi:hypothetical protein